MNKWFAKFAKVKYCKLVQTNDGAIHWKLFATVGQNSDSVRNNWKWFYNSSILRIEFDLYAE